MNIILFKSFTLDFDQLRFYLTVTSDHFVIIFCRNWTSALLHHYFTIIFTQVKVAFGDVWKESLTELSGGQRSLVALSLILALLLFKPAPIYILDEVDAALDLSHTQNIGHMLRTHFKHSQVTVYLFT